MAETNGNEAAAQEESPEMDPLVARARELSQGSPPEGASVEAYEDCGLNRRRILYQLEEEVPPGAVYREEAIEEAKIKLQRSMDNTANMRFDQRAATVYGNPNARRAASNNNNGQVGARRPSNNNRQQAPPQAPPLRAAANNNNGQQQEQSVANNGQQVPPEKRSRDEPSDVVDVTPPPTFPKRMRKIARKSTNSKPLPDKNTLDTDDFPFFEGEDDEAEDTSKPPATMERDDEAEVEEAAADSTNNGEFDISPSTQAHVSAVAQAVIAHATIPTEQEQATNAKDDKNIKDATVYPGAFDVGDFSYDEDIDGKNAPEETKLPTYLAYILYCALVDEKPDRNGKEMRRCMCCYFCDQVGAKYFPIPKVKDGEASVKDCVERTGKILQDHFSHILACPKVPKKMKDRIEWRIKNSHLEKDPKEVVPKPEDLVNHLSRQTWWKAAKLRIFKRFMGWPIDETSDD